MFQIVEHLILEKYSKELKVGSQQFGYKKRLGTELGVFALKSIVSHYNNNNTTVYACFLDASKAFDNVLHEKLCLKLCKRRIPMLVVKLFYVWCKTQRFRISWNGCESREFAIHKSVRQGGVLSPYLFNLYMNDLGVKLFASRIGCHIGHVATNNIWMLMICACLLHLSMLCRI